MRISKARVTARDTRERDNEQIHKLSHKSSLPLLSDTWEKQPHKQAMLLANRRDHAQTMPAQSPVTNTREKTNTQALITNPRYHLVKDT